MVVGALETRGLVAAFVQHVPGLQKVVEGEAVEVAEGLHTGQLHLHDQAPFGPALLHQARRFPKHGVRGPDPALHIGRAQGIEDGGQLVRRFDRNVVGGRRVVIGSALAPVGLGWDDVPAPGPLPVQAPAGAEHEELGGPGLPMDLVAGAGGDGGTDGGKVEGDRFSVQVEAVDGGDAVAGADVAHHGAVEPAEKMVVDLLGKEDQALVQQALLRPVEGRKVDHGLGMGVVLVDDHGASSFRRYGRYIPRNGGPGNTFPSFWPEGWTNERGRGIL